MQEGSGPQPFDVSTRRLIEADPAGWLAWIGLPADGPVTAIDSDVSTVLAEVDKVLRVEGPVPWIAHLELQASYDRLLPLRILEYHALLARRHEQPVVSTAILLRRSADNPSLTGRFELHGPTGEPTVTLNYRVIRLWERPVDELLNGGLGVLPLAPLSDVSPDRMPDVLGRLHERFQQESSATAIRELWAATRLLLGLRYDEGEIQGLVPDMSWVRESSTYQAILAEGREEGLEAGRQQGMEAGREQGRRDEARRTLVRLGTRRLGPPDAAILARLERIDDLDVLERLTDDALTASSWADLHLAEGS